MNNPSRKPGDVRQEMLAANRNYSAQFGEKSELAASPARQFAILTCMDARMDPARFAGLSEGDAHVIRNAGGRASEDAIRSLVISGQLLGTREWFVIHHTDCGMAKISNQSMGNLLGPEAAAIDWLVIEDQEQALVDDIERIRSHPLVPRDIPIGGFIYDVKTGKLVPVQRAMEAGHRGVGG